jgi:hypothetical protein
MVPNPNSANVVGLDDCYSKKCVPYQTVTNDVFYTDYANCQKSCMAEFYYNKSNSGGVPNVALPTGGAGGAGGESS